MKIHLMSQFKILALIICMASLIFSQTINPQATKEEVPKIDLSLEKASLIADLKSLNEETLKFTDALGEALGKAEIADAAWQLDRDWAKKLLRSAYELTIPKADQNQAQARPAGSIPPMPNSADNSQRKVRVRVLEIARQDKDFVKELVQWEADRLGAYAKQYASAVLADQSLMGGDVKESVAYILQGIEADPTQTSAPALINAVALLDRVLADRLILHYISELRKFPLSSGNQSDFRSFSILSSLVKPYLPYDPSVNAEPEKIPLPGPEVMRAYIGYMLEVLNLLDQKEPGYLQRRRATLLSLWVPLQQYAPDLASAFLNLDSRSRRPGDNSPLPTAASMEAARRAQDEKRAKEASDSDQPADGVIYMTTGKGEFDKARKMIDKLSDEAKKKQLYDMVNAEEAISLVTKGNVNEAENLAGKLTRASSILSVYPVLIGKCAAKKDQPCVTRLVYQALRQVKASDTSPTILPEGIPGSAVASDPKFDPISAFVAKLAIAILPYDTDLALDVVNEMVSIANAQPIDRAKIILDMSVFKKLAPKDEIRARQAADAFKNPITRVLALAAIYQWKAKELVEKQSKTAKVN